MMRAAALILALVATPALAAKKAPPAPEVAVDTAALEWARAPGANTIKGEAMLRTRGGDVRTCAGQRVALIPSSPYTDDFVRRAYGPNPDKKRPTISELAIPYVQAKRCNSQGQFSFTDLPDGVYHLIATVTWEAVQGRRYAYMATQGGEMVERVEVRGGKTEELIVTR